ncbi:MAG: thioredoxin family protein [Ignavibacteriaceae bacterium]|nr:thioredoxin family protein [Ignavibacteriaceae bacterium]NUM71758.1 thioredoxin family protein [Ignavibacteriaceae bacterium]
METAEIINRGKQGKTFSEFYQGLVNYLNSTDPAALSAKELADYNYTKLNVQRMKRIISTYKISESTAELLGKNKCGMFWLVITEGWCGDSAQSLPVISAIADAAPGVELRIIERDQNPDIMDLYLTDGKKSIPKVAGFSDEGEQLFIWGARPSNLQELVVQRISEGVSSEKWHEEVHAWYAKDKGLSVEAEFCEIVKKCYEVDVL